MTDQLDAIREALDVLAKTPPTLGGYAMPREEREAREAIRNNAEQWLAALVAEVDEYEERYALYLTTLHGVQAARDAALAEVEEWRKLAVRSAELRDEAHADRDRLDAVVDAARALKVKEQGPAGFLVESDSFTVLFDAICAMKAHASTPAETKGAG